MKWVTLKVPSRDDDNSVFFNSKYNDLGSLRVSVREDSPPTRVRVPLVISGYFVDGPRLPENCRFGGPCLCDFSVNVLCPPFCLG